MSDRDHVTDGHWEPIMKYLSDFSGPVSMDRQGFVEKLLERSPLALVSMRRQTLNEIVGDLN